MNATRATWWSRMFTWHSKVLITLILYEEAANSLSTNPSSHLVAMNAKARIVKRRILWLANCGALGIYIKCHATTMHKFWTQCVGRNYVRKWVTTFWNNFFKHIMAPSHLSPVPSYHPTSAYHPTPQKTLRWPITSHIKTLSIDFLTYWILLELFAINSKESRELRLYP